MTRMRFLRTTIILCILLPLFLISCREVSPSELSDSERRHADSLYLVQRDSMDVILDSICVANYDSVFRTKYDSILEKRIENIRKLLPDER